MVEKQNLPSGSTEGNRPSGSTDLIQWEYFDPKDPNDAQHFKEKMLDYASSKEKQQPKLERHPGSGNRPQEKIPGLLRISKKCKICQSSCRDEITMALLNGMKYREIIEKWGDKIENFGQVNINSHRKHCDPKAVAKIDVNRRELSLVDLDPAVVQLYQQKYDEALNKFKTVSLLYDARLKNLWELLAAKKNLESKPAAEKDGFYNKEIKELTTAIDEIMKGLTKDLLNHIKIESQGPGLVQVNVAMVSNFKKGITEFIEDFMDVLVGEIDDPLARERIKERFIEKLETRISPLLDPSKMVTVDARIIDDEEE